jgi:hypothetical protein
MSDLFEHPPDLPIAAFRERDLVPGVVALAHNLDLRRQRSDRERAAAFAGTLPSFALCHGRFGGKLDAGSEPVELLFAGLAAYLDKIGLRDVRGRSSQLLHQVAVIGEQQESLGVEIEAPDGEDALADIANEIHDGGAAFGIADRGHELPGLVEHDVDMLLGALDAFAVDADIVGLKVGFRAERGYGFTVNGYTSASDELLCLATGSIACGGEDLLQTF